LPLQINQTGCLYKYLAIINNHILNNMKKSTLFVTLFFAIQCQLQAQLVRLESGTRLGLSRGVLTTEFPNFFEGPIQTGFTAGAFGRLTAYGFFMQPEAMFSQRVGKFEDQNNPEKNFRNSLSYLDVNAIFGYRIGGVLRLSLGTSYGILLNASQVDNGISTPEFSKEAFQSTVLFLQYGAGFDLGRFSVDLRRERNVSQQGKILSTPTSMHDYRTNTRQWIFTVGVKILDTKRM
jgi:hypothetical protein